MGEREFEDIKDTGIQKNNNKKIIYSNQKLLMSLQEIILNGSVISVLKANTKNIGNITCMVEKNCSLCSVTKKA